MQDQQCLMLEHFCFEVYLSLWVVRGLYEEAFCSRIACFIDACLIVFNDDAFYCDEYTG